MGNTCSQKNKLIVKSSIYIKSIQKSSNIKVPLSSKEVATLKRTWPMVKQNWLKICLVAFERWFTLYPQLRYMFRSLPEDLLFEDLFKTDVLRTHVEKVRDVLDMLLVKIDDVEELVNILIEFGRQHHVLGARQKYATALAASFQFGICMIMDVDLLVENAWDSLLRFVMDLLKMGMRLEKEDEKVREKNASLAEENNNKQTSLEVEEKIDEQQTDIEHFEKEPHAKCPVGYISNNTANGESEVTSQNSNVRTFYVAEAEPDNG